MKSFLDSMIGTGQGDDVWTPILLTLNVLIATQLSVKSIRELERGWSILDPQMTSEQGTNKKHFHEI